MGLKVDVERPHRNKSITNRCQIAKSSLGRLGPVTVKVSTVGRGGNGCLPLTLIAGHWRPRHDNGLHARKLATQYLPRSILYSTRATAFYSQEWPLFSRPRFSSHTKSIVTSHRLRRYSFSCRSGRHRRCAYQDEETLGANRGTR
jgi:hypothetical protein